MTGSLFIALPAECEQTRSALSRSAPLIRAALPQGASLAPPPSLHITLRFLGTPGAAPTPDLQQLLDGVAAEHPPLHLHLAGLAMFQNSDALWAHPKGDVDALRLLRRSIDQAVRSLGLPPADFPFRAHMTIGRITGADARTLAQLRSSVHTVPLHSDTFTADHVHLQLSEQGQHTTLSEHRLDRAWEPPVPVPI